MKQSATFDMQHRYVVLNITQLSNYFDQFWLLSNVLSRIAKWVTGAGRSASTRSICLLIDSLKSDPQLTSGKVFEGCLLRRLPLSMKTGGDTLAVVSLQPQRRDPTLEIALGESGIWANRFKIKLQPGVPRSSSKTSKETYCIRPLDMKYDIASLKGEVYKGKLNAEHIRIFSRVPPSARTGIPAVTLNDRIIALPTFGFYLEKGIKATAELV